MDAPEDILCVKLAEACSSTKAMGNLFYGGGFVMLSHYGVIKVLRVKAYTECTIRLVGVGKQVDGGYGKALQDWLQLGEWWHNCLPGEWLE